MDARYGRPVSDTPEHRLPFDAPPVWRVLAWACFLGCSWTWVIGMLAPALLTRDLGMPGFWAFTVPNILGAAAMGWVLSRSGAQRVLATHGAALRWFSDVTIAFHVFVLFGMGSQLLGPAAWAAAAVPMVVLARERRRLAARWLPWLAIPLTLVSWTAWSMMNGLPPTTGLPSAEAGGGAAAWAATRTPAATDTPVIYFLCASVMGFALCPYLDASFNRARAATGRIGGPVAFTIGFVVVFGSMPFFTLMYASVVQPVFGGGPVVMGPGWRILLGLHLLLQAAFTLTVHLRERVELDPGHRRLSVLTALILIALSLAAWGPQVELHGMTGNEWGYRVFLLLYGSVFPGYVFLRMLLRPARPSPMVLSAALTAATALAYIGFVVGAAWCLPLAAVPLVACGAWERFR